MYTIKLNAGQQKRDYKLAPRYDQSKHRREQRPGRCIWAELATRLRFATVCSSKWVGHLRDQLNESGTEQRPAANGGRATSNGTRPRCDSEGVSRFVERFSRHRKYKWELKPKRKPQLGLWPPPIHPTNIGTRPLFLDPDGRIRPVHHAVHKNTSRATVSSCTRSSSYSRGQHYRWNWLNLRGGQQKEMWPTSCLANCSRATDALLFLSSTCHARGFHKQ